MAFMQKQIVRGTWYVVEAGCTDYVPAALVNVEELAVGGTITEDDVSEERWQEICKEFRDYLSESPGRYGIQEISLVEGYGARLSAPGYMDCTEWSVFDTEAEALACLEEMYGKDEESEDEESEDEESEDEESEDVW